jgi:protein gp37
MAETTHIEWTDATWNPITGCTVVSEGCRNCYAMALAGTRLAKHPSRTGLTRRNAAGKHVWTGGVRFNEQWLDQPLRWLRSRMIFVCAHGDLFHESVPDEWIDRVFAVMALAHQHVFQVLTKRPDRMRDYCAGIGTSDRVWQATKLIKDHGHTVALNYHSGGRALFEPAPWPLRNVWIGTSVEDQTRANQRIPLLLDTPAVVRWVSAEPLLGPLNLQHFDVDGDPISDARIDWIVVGGESGPGARPMHPGWARALRDQCAEAQVPFFFKQWGDWSPRDAWVRGFLAASMVAIRSDGSACDDYADEFEPDGQRFERIGKGRAGRLLDGIEYNGMPRVHAACIECVATSTGRRASPMPRPPARSVQRYA